MIQDRRSQLRYRVTALVMRGAPLERISAAIEIPTRLLQSFIKGDEVLEAEELERIRLRLPILEQHHGALRTDA